MTQQPDVCACGRDAIDVVPVASEDGLLLISVCAECADDPVVEQRELFEHAPRRPLSGMPARSGEPQQSLALDADRDEECGAA